MSWAKLDDRANEHRKQLAAGPEACWLWACGLMYCNRQPARDGFIPAQVVAMLYPAKKPQALAAKLVAVGLWEKVEGGFLVHDFGDWNKSREQVEAEREATRNRVASHRAKAQCNAVTESVTPPVSNALVPDHSYSTPTPTPNSKVLDLGLARAMPDQVGPSRARAETPEPAAPAPEAPAGKASKARKKTGRWRVAPAEWIPAEHLAAKANELGVDYGRELQKFRLHEFAAPKSDADRAFGSWLLRASEMGSRFSAAKPKQPNSGYQPPIFGE